MVDSDGTIVTNAHVVGQSSTVEVEFADDETARANVTGVDASSDLAVLKVDTNRPLKALQLADSSTVRPGQLAVAIGSPFGLSQTVTSGIVSGTGRHIQAPDGFQIDSVIQTDAPINPGNSGGPLLDATGKVIGVNSQIASQSGGNVGIGFAVPSNTVRDVIPRLERGEAIQRAYLGVSTSAGNGGVSVASVSNGSPAAEAGLRVGDVIVSVAGKKVSEPDDVAAAIQDRKPGETVAIELARGRHGAGEAGRAAMTFQSPWLLLGLLLLPLIAALYVVSERRRRRAAAAFAAPAVSASVVPRRPGWRRHAPLVLAGVATAGLIGALARPQVTVAVPAEQATIVLAMDHSGSMMATDVAPSRLAAARDAGETFLDKVPERVRVGGVVFNHRAEAVASPTTDRDEVRDALEAAMKPSGGTATGDALATSLAMARTTRAPGAIVLLSDGASTHGRDPLPLADEAKRLKIPIYTVALGTPSGTLPNGDAVPPDTATLREIASRSGGQAFTASEADALSAVYDKLGSEVATKKEKREVTAGFAGGAALLLLMGGGLSLKWFRRLL